MRARVLALLSLVLGSALLSAQVAPVYQVVVANDPVELDIAVSSAGKAAANLSADDFSVLEDGQPQQIRDFQPIGIPYSLLFMVDRSGRDEESAWPTFVLDSVDFFLRNLRGPDRLAVAAFDDRVAVVLDWRPSRNGSLQNIMLRRSSQPTRFFDAIQWASEEMKETGRTSGRRGVLVFTDGRDVELYPQITTSGGRSVPDPQYEVPASAELRFTEALETVRRGNVPFYFVAIDTDRQLSRSSGSARLEGWMKFLEAVRSRVEHLAEVSGGLAAFPRETKDLAPLFERIQRDLGTGYHITYNPRKSGDGKLRRIEVRPRDSSLQVYQSQTTYYAR
jgi:VWFA-related protein